MEFSVVSVKEVNGRTIWQGRNALTGAFLVTVATQNEWHAVLVVPASGSFEFHATGMNASVAERNDPVQCGDSPVFALADFADEVAVLPAELSAADDNGEQLKISRQVDVLFFYDAATLAACDGNKELLETALSARIEAANLVLENSRVASFRWRFLASYQIPVYTSGERLADDLGAITYTDKPTGRFVEEKCELHGADQAMLLVTGKRDYAGLAWVPSTHESVAYHAVARWDSSYTVMAHELAHNFGCRHDRQSEKAGDDDAAVAYGHRFVYRGEDTGTVMSYAPNRVPYFSNPEVLYSGIKLGVEEGRLGAADNARLLDEKAMLMAAHRETVSEPIITEGPKDTTVIRGAEIKLRVIAAGDGLTFQWRRNGRPIDGAVGAVYSKANAVEQDDGAYDVMVANAHGEAMSAQATVVVATPAATQNAQPATQANNQASGGTGGGAPSWLFMGMIVLAASLRKLVPQRQRRTS